MDRIQNREDTMKPAEPVGLDEMLTAMKEYAKPNNYKKWVISVSSGVLFFIIASPLLFKIVNYLTSRLGVSILDYQGKPNMIGYILHTIVFILIVRLSMGV